MSDVEPGIASLFWADLCESRAEAVTLRATLANLADQWDEDADSWDGPAHVDVVAAAHGYAQDLRAALTTP